VSGDRSQGNLLKCKRLKHPLKERKNPEGAYGHIHFIGNTPNWKNHDGERGKPILWQKGGGKVAQRKTNYNMPQVRYAGEKMSTSTWGEKNTCDAPEPGTKKKTLKTRRTTSSTKRGAKISLWKILRVSGGEGGQAAGGKQNGKYLKGGTTTTRMKGGVEKTLASVNSERGSTMGKLNLREKRGEPKSWGRWEAKSPNN